MIVKPISLFIIVLVSSQLLIAKEFLPRGKIKRFNQFIFPSNRDVKTSAQMSYTDDAIKEMEQEKLDSPKLCKNQVYNESFIDQLQIQAGEMYKMSRCSMLLYNQESKLFKLEDINFKDECACIENATTSKESPLNPLGKKEALRIQKFMKDQETNNSILYFAKSYSNYKVTQELYDLYHPEESSLNDMRCNSTGSIIKAIKDNPKNRITKKCSDSIIKKIGHHSNKHKLVCFDKRNCHNKDLESNMDHSINTFANIRLQSINSEEDVKKISLNLIMPLTDLAIELLNNGYPTQLPRNWNKINAFYENLDPALSDELTALNEALNKYTIFNFDALSAEGRVDLPYILSKVIPQIEIHKKKNDNNIDLQKITTQTLNKLMNKEQRKQNCNAIIDNFKSMCDVMSEPNEIFSLKLDLNNNISNSRQQLLNDYSKQYKDNPLPLRKYLCHLENQYTDKSMWDPEGVADYDTSDDGKKNITFKGNFLSKDARKILNSMQVTKINPNELYDEEGTQQLGSVKSTFANIKDTPDMTQQNNYTNKDLSGSYSSRYKTGQSAPGTKKNKIINNISNFLSDSTKRKSSRNNVIKQSSRQNQNKYDQEKMISTGEVSKPKNQVIQNQEDQTSYGMKKNSYTPNTWQNSNLVDSVAPKYDTESNINTALPTSENNLSSMETQRLQKEILDLKKKLQEKGISKDEVKDTDKDLIKTKSDIELQKMKLKLAKLQLDLEKEKAKNKQKLSAKKQNKTSSSRQTAISPRYKNTASTSASVYNSSSIGTKEASQNITSPINQTSRSNNTSEPIEQSNQAAVGINSSPQSSAIINQSTPKFTEAVLLLSSKSDNTPEQNNKIQEILRDKFKSYTGPYYDGEKYVIMFENDKKQIEAKFLNEEEFSSYKKSKTQRVVGEEKNPEEVNSTDILFRHKNLSDVLDLEEEEEEEEEKKIGPRYQ